MIRTLLVSDLHLEFQRDGGLSLVTSLPEADVLIVAGDLTNAKGLSGALKMLSRKYPDVVFVPGNHEFYGGSRATVSRAFDERPANVHWLDRDTVTLHGQRYVGCTLWFPDTAEARANSSFIGDFHHIKDPLWIFDEFEENKSFLSETVEPDDIVITHHLPTVDSIAPRFKSSILNCFFLGNVGPLISRTRPRLWLHGHAHDSCDYTYADTRVICNPIGYPGEHHVEWKPVWIGGTQ